MTITQDVATEPVSMYRSAGYSAIDHQLDPLVDVCGDWLGHEPTPELRQQRANDLAETIEAAAALVRAMGTPAEPLDVECFTCGADVGKQCWHLTHYTDLKHPHPDRVEAVKGTTKAEWMSW